VTAAADAGSRELLLDDAVRLAQREATDDVEAILDITPGVPHFIHAHLAILDESGVALDRAGEFLSARLVSTEQGVEDRQAERRLAS
jgi:monoterpene epsilon-lactone hydrolase